MTIHKVFIIWMISSIFFIHDDLLKAVEIEAASPKIIDIKTTPTPIINQWVILRQKSTGELRIEVSAENTVKVIFWTVPVRNKSWQDSWGHRRLIYEDSNGTDGWSTIFNYGEDNLLSFIVVEAVGEDGSSERWPFYVAYKK